MSDRYVDMKGEPVQLQALKHQMSCAIVAAVQDSPHCSLVEVRSAMLEGNLCEECIIIDIKPEVSQKRVNDIRSIERVGIIVRGDGIGIQDVLALRSDFPRVPHTNLRQFEVPKSICLYVNTHEAALKWTPRKFLEDIRSWLERTAKGELHEETQQLEPFLLSSNPQLILPWDLFPERSSAAFEDIVIRKIETTGQPRILIGHKKGSIKLEQNEAVCRVLLLSLSPQVHGVINHEPGKFVDLARLVEGFGIDLLKFVRDSLKGVLETVKHKRPQLMVLLLKIPRKRIVSGVVEKTEWWSFLIGRDVKDLGSAVGLWKVQGQEIGLLVPMDQSQRGDGVAVETLNTTFSFNRPLARASSGLGQGVEKSVALVGCGAVGSHVLMNFLRMGIGKWTLIDNDCLLPHNLARHTSPGYFVGFPKVMGLQEFCNDLLPGFVSGYFDWKVSEVAAFSDELKAQFSEMDIILDATASVAASRVIARDVESAARRMSMFVNPGGNDAVFLSEDSSRTIRLDYLEMQYYRLVLKGPKLVGHMNPTSRGIRYGGSCSDISTIVATDSVSILSGVLSKAFRGQIQRDEASIRVWRLNDEASIESVSAPVFPACEFQVRDWKIVVDDGFREILSNARQSRLPNETGGVIIGCFDTKRRIIYVVDTILSPPDSKERRDAYIRGKKGLPEALQRTSDVSGGMLEYVGEWHSHPRGHTVDPSLYDLNVLSWLDNIMRPFGLPALMVIAGDSNTIGCYLTEP